MAKYRQIHTDFWDDGFVVDLTIEEKYFYMYLMTNAKTSQCGIYELPKRVISNQTGFDREIVDKFLKRFEEYKKINYSEETKEILIINWIKYNQPNNPNAIKCVNKELKNIKNKNFIKIFYTKCVNLKLDIENIFNEVDLNEEPLEEVFEHLQETKEHCENAEFEGACKGLISKEIISNKQKVINNKEEVAEEIKKEDEKNIISYAAAAKRNPINFFANNIYKPKEEEHKKIRSWMASVDCDVIILAMEEAVLYNARNLKYIEKVLNSWRKKGLNTRDSVINYKNTWHKRDRKESEKVSNWDLENQRQYDFKDLERKLLGWDTN